HHKIAGVDLHPRYAHRRIDRHGLQAPLAGDGTDGSTPYRKADSALLLHIAYPAVDDRAHLPLPLGDRGGNPAHVGDAVHAFYHQHITRLRKIVSLDLRHAGYPVARSLVGLIALLDI